MDNAIHRWLEVLVVFVDYMKIRMYFSPYLLSSYVFTAL